MTTRNWLTLSLAPGIGTHNLEALLDHFGQAEAVLNAKPAELQGLGLSAAAAAALRNPDAARLAACEAWLSQPAHHFLHWEDSRYPPLLRATGQAPAGLYVQGDPDALSLPQLAIVGSRSATPGGIETATQFAAHLAAAGIVITSGLARGIDAAAHQGALHASGKTIAVCGTGPDVVYPAQHEALARQIEASGALVSELPPGTPPQRHQFPRRNRLISGLAMGTLVVEAGTRSGSLITARYSGEQGREVFAIPGSIHSPLSKGCHRLIRQGAKLVETADDIIEELGALAGTLADPQSHTEAVLPHIDKPDEDYIKLLESMGFDPLSIGQLAERTGLTAEQLSSMLLILELDGQVDPLPGGRFQRRATRD
jgi:DNA processing protein